MFDKKQGRYIIIVENRLEVIVLHYRNGTTSILSLSLSLSLSLNKVFLSQGLGLLECKNERHEPKGVVCYL
jgi:hypothetical protein